MSVRVRIALWFAAALTTILILYSGGVYLWLKHSLVAGVDQQLHEDYETAEERLRLSDGKVSLSGGYEHEEEESGKELPKWIDVFGKGGEILYSNKPGEVHVSVPSMGCFGARNHYETLALPGIGSVRTLCEAHTIDSIPSTVRVVRSLEPIDHALRELMLVIAIALPLGIGLSGFGGYVLARRALSPVGKMVSRAKTITADKLKERLPVENPRDELGTLASVFNDTFARLERSFDQMKRFSSDASHELRTPLTALRSVGEVYLRNDGHERCRETVASMLEESDRMQQLIECLLTLSRADAGQIRLNAKPEDLAEIAKDVVKHLEVLAEEKGQRLTLISDGPIFSSVDAVLLRQALINLVDNAIKYSPPHSEVEVKLTRKDRKAILEVRDRGPGIPLEQQARVFDRFYRVDESRSRDLGGFGLGLSIAKWAVEINDGQLELDSKEGGGSVFRIKLQAEGVFNA